MEPRLGFDYETGALYLGITERQLRNAKSRGEIEFAKIGNTIRFSQTALDAFLAKNTVAAQS